MSVKTETSGISALGTEQTQVLFESMLFQVKETCSTENMATFEDPRDLQRTITDRTFKRG